MSDIPPLFAVVTFLAAALATISIWSPRPLLTKVMAIAVACSFMPAAYAAMVGLLSKPKPADFEWWMAHTEEATVLGNAFEEGKAIYVWLQLDGLREPRAYVLPWDRKLAEELQQATRDAAEQQSTVRMRVPFEPSLDDREPRVYALPQPALPPKDGDAPPMRYQHPETEA